MQRKQFNQLKMKTKSFIIWPEEKLKTLEAICFLEQAGYRHNYDFTVNYNGILQRMVITPLNQIILAQDAIKLGFEKVEI